MRKPNYVLPFLLLATLLGMAWLAVRTASRLSAPEPLSPPVVAKPSTPDARHPTPGDPLAHQPSPPEPRPSTLDPLPLPPPDTSTPDARGPTPGPISEASLPPTSTLTLSAEALPDDPAPYMDRYPAASIQVVKMTPLPALLGASPSGNYIRQLVIPLPGGRTVAVRITNHRVIAKGRGVFTGHVEGLPLSEVILSYYQDAITANIILPGDGHYAIATEGKIQLLIEVDPDKILPGADPIIPPIQPIDETGQTGGNTP